MFPTLRSWLARVFAMVAGWPRRAAAALCLVLAAVSALGNQRPSIAAPATVLVAARDLDAGSTIAPQDLRAVGWPAELRPGSALDRPDELVGRQIGAPMARGEPFSSARMLDTTVARQLRRGQVAVSIPIETNGSTALIQPGVQIDVYARPPAGTIVDGTTVDPPLRSSLIVSAAQVLAVLAPDHGAMRGDAGPTAAIVIGTTRAVALQVANNASGSFLATLVPPS